MKKETDLMPSISRLRTAFLNSEVVSYGVFGVLTTFVNVGFFEVLLITGMDYRPANLIALVITKLFAYVVNKLFVFRTNTSGLITLAAEFARFALARGGTMLVDWFGRNRQIYPIDTCLKNHMNISRRRTTYGFEKRQKTLRTTWFHRYAKAD